MLDIILTPHNNLHGNNLLEQTFYNEASKKELSKEENYKTLLSSVENIVNKLSKFKNGFNNLNTNIEAESKIALFQNSLFECISKNAISQEIFNKFYPELGVKKNKPILEGAEKLNKAPKAPEPKIY